MSKPEWVDITDEVNALEAQRTADPRRCTIALDCPPGLPRPGDLIAGVLLGTGLVAGEPESMAFGCWTWVFDMDQQEWERRVQPIVAPRIRRLYAKGLIRYGDW